MDTLIKCFLVSGFILFTVGIILRSWRVETTDQEKKFDYAGNIVLLLSALLIFAYVGLIIKQSHDGRNYIAWNESLTPSANIFTPSLDLTMKHCVWNSFSENKQNQTMEKLKFAEKTCSYKLLSYIKLHESDEVYNLALANLQTFGYWTPVKIMDTDYTVEVPFVVISDKDIQRMKSDTNPCDDKEKTVCIE